MGWIWQLEVTITWGAQLVTSEQGFMGGPLAVNVQSEYAHPTAT
jgi:hypothetical protein